MSLFLKHKNLKMIYYYTCYPIAERNILNWYKSGVNISEAVFSLRAWLAGE